MSRRDVRVAVVYSGRWFWPLNRPWVENHRQYLIEPNSADVYLVSSFETWCSPTAAGMDREPRELAERALWQEVSEAFGRHAAAVRFVDDPTPKTIRGTMSLMSAAVLRVMPKASAEQVKGYSNSAYKAVMVYNWRKQLAKLALVEMLRLESRANRQPHDVIVKARIDVGFSFELPARKLHPIKNAVYASASRSSTTDQQVWRDWLYITDEAGFATLAQIGKESSSLRFNATARCFGFCQEEQTYLQLASRGVPMHELTDPPWSMVLHKAGTFFARSRNASSRSRASLVSQLGLREGCEDAAVMSTGLQPWSGPASTVRRDESSCSHARNGAIALVVAALRWLSRAAACS
jgi:hypothetical protein